MAEKDVEKKPVEGTPAEPEKKPEAQAPALTAIEERAAAQGWVPQDEWDGDPDQWRPAKEFIDRGELFKKIDDQNRTIKEFQKTLHEFARHHSKVKETEYQRALADLKARKKEALSEGDADALIDIDERIDMVKEAQRTDRTPQVPVVPEVNPIFSAWEERNGWYNNNKAMRAYADRIGNDVASRGGISPTDLLAHIEREVKKEFAHKFNNPNRDRASAVEGSTNKSGKSKDTFVLDDTERQVAQRFIKSIPGMTMEKYVADLKKIKGV